MRRKARAELGGKHVVGDHVLLGHLPVGLDLTVLEVRVHVGGWNSSAFTGLVEAVHLSVSPVGDAGIPKVIEPDRRRKADRSQRDPFSVVREPIGTRIGARITGKEVIETAILLNDDDDVLERRLDVNDRGRRRGRRRRHERRGPASAAPSENRKGWGKDREPGKETGKPVHQVPLEKPVRRRRSPGFLASAAASLTQESPLDILPEFRNRAGSGPGRPRAVRLLERAGPQEPRAVLGVERVCTSIDRKRDPLARSTGAHY